MRQNWQMTIAIMTALLAIGLQQPSDGRPVPDETLGEERSRVIDRSPRDFDVDGGARRGRNLFHSFQEFGVDDGGSVYFLNPSGVENIFSRVTGGARSDILGRLGVRGAANLFLMNPNGILFGPNSSLDLGGSFVGTTANSIQFGNLGFFDATNPGSPSPLLTVNPSAFLFNQVVNQGGTIASTGNLATGQDLTLSGTILDLQGQLVAGRDLTLDARDTLRIRDTATAPFVAASGGQMLVQGDRVVDIFALNHPNSGLVSGGDMVLRSANQVGGDAHYWSGGNFRIEQLNGGLGDLYSPYDPIIIASGDISFDNYTGQSLHILAGGNVVIPGTILINETDTNGTAVAETIKLSDGTTIKVDGSSQPTVDIRAGIDWIAAIGQLPPNLGIGIQVPPNFFGANATNADITVGNIAVDLPGGLIFLTNQYAPNRSLPGGTITVAGAGANPDQLIQNGVDARGFFGDGSSVVIDARNNIVVKDNAGIDTSAGIFTGTGRGGNISLLADNEIQLENESHVTTSVVDDFFNSSNIDTQGGSILFHAPTVTLKPYATVNASRGGNIGVQSDRLVMQEFSAISSAVLGSIDGGDVSIQATEAVIVDGGTIGTLVFPEASANGGDIIISTEELTVIGAAAFTNYSGITGIATGGDISSDATGSSDAGDITIDARRISLIDGAQIRASVVRWPGSAGSSGDAGDITLRASDSIEVTGTIADIDGNILRNNFLSKIATSMNSGTSGDGGNLLIETNRLTVSNGAQIQAGMFGSGQGGSITVNAPELIEIFDKVIDENATGFFMGPEGSEASGDGGDLVIRTGQLSLLGSDSEISNEVDSEASGDAGNSLIEVDRLVVGNGARITAGTLGAGQGGALKITASESVDLFGTGNTTEGNEEPSAIFTATFGYNNAGNLALTTDQLSIRNGATITASTQGLGVDTSLGTGRGGSITIDASAIEIIGTSFSGDFASSITSETGRLFGVLNPLSAAPGGRVSITADQLTVRNGAEISTQTFSSGNAGDLTIDAPTSIELFASNISAQTSGNGDGGNIDIQTQLLSLNDSAAITTNTTGKGNTGTISVQASDRVSLHEQSQITSTVEASASGNSQQVRLQTPNLEATNSQISAATFGKGNAGSVVVENADTVSLNNSSISSAINTGATSTRPGNIDIQAQNLNLTNDAEITASTSGAGNAGGIRIRDSDRVNLDRSTISTTVNQGAIGNSGNITLDTNRLNLDRSDITASTFGRGNAGAIDVQNAERINLDRSTISTTVNQGAIGNGGNIDIETGTLNLDRSNITSSTSGQGDTGRITIDANDHIALRDNSSITSTVNRGATGNSQRISLNTPNISLRGNSRISAATNGNGSAGDVQVEADRISLSNSRLSTQVGRNADTSRNNTRSQTQRDDRQGNIRLNTRSLNLNNNAEITSRTRGNGRAGNIRVNHANNILVDNSTISSEVNPNGRGRGGNIRLQTGRLNLDDNAQINAQTRGNGRAGDVTVRDADNISLNNSAISTGVGLEGRGRGGNVELGTDDLNLENTARITANTRGDGRAGDINIRNADNISVEQSVVSSAVGAESSGQGGNITFNTGNLDLDQARISARTQAEGRGGNITIDASDAIESTDSDIETLSIESFSGDIRVSADAIRLRGDSDIRTQVEEGTGTGGNITLSANSIVTYNDSDIVTRAPEGQGGDITIDSPAFFAEGYIPDLREADGNNRVDIDASGVSSGTVSLPDVTFIQNSLSDLPANAIDSDRLLANSCIARTESGGTFLITGSGGLPERPGNSTTSTYPTGEVRSIPVEAAPPDNQSWQPGDPIVEPQGVYRLPDGRLIMSRECHSSNQ